MSENASKCCRIGACLEHAATQVRTWQYSRLAFGRRHEHLCSQRANRAAHAKSSSVAVRHMRQTVCQQNAISVASLSARHNSHLELRATHIVVACRRRLGRGRIGNRCRCHDLCRGRATDDLFQQAATNNRPSTALLPPYAERAQSHCERERERTVRDTPPSSGERRDLGFQSTRLAGTSSPLLSPSCIRQYRAPHTGNVPLTPLIGFADTA